MSDSASKRCRECGEAKPFSEFYRRPSSRDGYRNDCKECVRSRAGRWYETHPAAAAQARRRYSSDHRSQVFDHYGHLCVCCGATENLTIDHVDGGGQEHRIELFGEDQGRAGSTFYRWLVRQGLPPGYQTLCRPCNASKRSTPACRLDHSTEPLT